MAGKKYGCPEENSHTLPQPNFYRTRYLLIYLSQLNLFIMGPNYKHNTLTNLGGNIRFKIRKFHYKLKINK